MDERELQEAQNTDSREEAALDNAIDYATEDEELNMEDKSDADREVKEDEKEKKPKTFGKGMFIGVLSGIIGAVMVLWLGVNIYQNVTGYPILLGSNSISVVTNDSILDEETAVKLDELMEYIAVLYDGEYDEDDLRNSLYAGLLDGLGDPYSTYYTAEEYADFQVSTSGSFCGIGAGLQQDADTMEVIIKTVYDDTPASEAGLLAGDYILSADGIEATSMELSDFISNIRGEAGTTVTLEIYRPDTDETFTVDVTRRQVVLPSVAGQILENHIGYIQISEFQTNTAIQFESVYDELEEDGMEYLIVDLRDNPGGTLDSVTALLDYLLPEGTIVSVENKYGTVKEYTSDASCVDIPLVVLVNGNSASASEIFAGAIKDYEYGTLIGTTTYGKGIVQSIYPLSDGDAIKITTAKYYTPSGSYIHGVGIDPDIELEYEFLGTEEDTYSWELDNQIQKAIEVLLAE